MKGIILWLSLLLLSGGITIVMYSESQPAVNSDGIWTPEETAKRMAEINRSSQELVIPPPLSTAKFKSLTLKELIEYLED